MLDTEFIDICRSFPELKETMIPCCSATGLFIPQEVCFSLSYNDYPELYKYAVPETWHGKFPKDYVNIIRKSLLDDGSHIQEGLIDTKSITFEHIHNEHTVINIFSKSCMAFEDKSTKEDIDLISKDKLKILIRNVIDETLKVANDVKDKTVTELKYDNYPNLSDFEHL